MDLGMTVPWCYSFLALPFIETFINMGCTGRQINWKITQEILSKTQTSKIRKNNINKLAFCAKRAFVGIIHV